jgi:hypothetical protein
MSTRLHIVVPDELVERLDQARGIASRSAWVQYLPQPAGPIARARGVAGGARAVPARGEPRDAHTTSHTTPILWLCRAKSLRSTRSERFSCVRAALRAVSD